MSYYKEGIFYYLKYYTNFRSDLVAIKTLKSFKGFFEDNIYIYDMLYRLSINGPTYEGTLYGYCSEFKYYDEGFYYVKIYMPFRFWGRKFIYLSFIHYNKRIGNSEVLLLGRRLINLKSLGIDEIIKKQADPLELEYMYTFGSDKKNK